MDKKTEEFYIRLREELSNTSAWPSEYLYKFIVPTSPKKIEEVENAFDNMYFPFLDFHFDFHCH